MTFDLGGAQIVIGEAEPGQHTVTIVLPDGHELLEWWGKPGQDWDSVLADVRDQGFQEWVHQAIATRANRSGRASSIRGADNDTRPTDARPDQP